MNSKEISAQERIILATIDLIGRDGIQSLTTRSIAKEAGVNSAAINYYFGTKEKLVDKALSQTLDEMSGLPEEILDCEDMDPLKRLQAFFSAVTEGIFNYPGITKAHLYAPLMENDYSTFFVRRFNAFIVDFLSKIKGVKIKGKSKDLKMVAVQIISAILVPSLMPKLVKSVNFNNAETRRAYVATLVDLYFE